MLQQRAKSEIDICKVIISEHAIHKSVRTYERFFFLQKAAERFIIISGLILLIFSLKYT